MNDQNSIIKVLSKSGLYTYKYQNKFLYSFYDPEKEAEKYINSFSKINETVLTFCGADFINNNLEKKGKTIISFEPFKFDKLCTKPIRLDSLEQIENFLKTNNIKVSKLTVITWPGLIEAIPELCLSLLNNLKELLVKLKFSNDTEDTYGFVETKNLLLNLNNFNPKILLKNFKEIINPAIILSSGGSLKNNIDFINKIKERCYLFALPSSLPYLQKSLIEPDFVLTVDPGYASYYHLSKYSKPIFLITPLTITQSILKLKNFSQIIVSYGSQLEKEIYPDKTVTILPEGSVFINLLRLLPQIGFKKAVIIGQDFGFYNNRFHIEEGSFETEHIVNSNYFKSLEFFIVNQESKNKTTIRIKDNVLSETKGKEIITTYPLKIYYDHFINSTFDLDLFLPDKYFTPLNNVKTMAPTFIIKNFPVKDNKKTFIKTCFLNDQQRIKLNDRFMLLKKIVSERQNINDEENNFLKSIFMDSDEKKYKKISKITRGF